MPLDVSLSASISIHTTIFGAWSRSQGTLGQGPKVETKNKHPFIYYGQFRDSAQNTGHVFGVAKETGMENPEKTSEA